MSVLSSVVASVVSGAVIYFLGVESLSGNIIAGLVIGTIVGKVFANERPERVERVEPKPKRGWFD